jgi:hypothetical protein
MRFLATLLTALSLALPATAADMAGRLSHPLRLEGVGWQDDGSHWSIDVILSEKGGQIAYPSLDCAGDWTRTGQTLDAFIYREHIFHNAETCIEFGTVLISEAGPASYFYEFREDGTGAVIARAVLVEVGAARRPYMDLLLETLHKVDLDYLRPDFFR